MEKDEKELINELKFFDKNILYQKGAYIDFCLQNNWYQAYIVKPRQNNKYNIAFTFINNQIQRLNEVPIKCFGIFCENYFKEIVRSRGDCFNQDLCKTNLKQILQLFNIKLKKFNIQLNKDFKEEKNQSEKKKDGKSEDKVENIEKTIKNEKKENETIKSDDNNKEIDKDSNKTNNENNLVKNEIKKKNDNKDNEYNLVQNKINYNNDNEKIDNNINNENKDVCDKDINKEKEKENENNKKGEIDTSEILETENKTAKSSISSDNNNIYNSKINNNSENNGTKIINKSLTKLDKNGNPVNLLGYYTFQFLGGFLIDCFYIVSNNFGKKIKNQNLEDLLYLIDLSLDTIIFVSTCVRNNLQKIKSTINNSQLNIVSQLHAIIASFKIIINNCNELYLFQWDEIIEKLKLFANICYQILIESQEINALPLKLLNDLIVFISTDNVKILISNYDENRIYMIFLSYIENLSETELKNIKNHEMKEDCKYIINQIFGQSKILKINTCYNTYLINCLKCNNLEKKMNALNDIKIIIKNISDFDNFYDFFVKKNKILDLFFEESVHEEILKRAIIIFKYLAVFNKLSDEIIEKLIKEQKNESMKIILCEVISELPSEKKILIFNHLIKNLNFDENKSDIEYISRLTEACFSPSLEDESSPEIDIITQKEKNNDENDKKEIEAMDNKYNQKYYGLALLLNFIIKDFNDKKPYDKNNVNFAIESFNHVVIFSEFIEQNDLYFFMDLLFDNIKSNEKHNSVIQSIILIKKLMSKFYHINNEDEIVKALDEKYNIISLIVNDFIRYINILPDEDHSKINDKTIYEGIYPHQINIEERLDLIFIFIRGEYTHYTLKIESKHIEMLYKLLKQQQFNNELQRLLISLSRNLKYIDNETIKTFYKDILLNPNEFDIINFTDLYTLNIIKDLFFKINHDNNSIIRFGKKIRVVDQNIEGFDLLFDILVNNKTSIIQKQISQLLCDLCLYLKDYKSDFHEKYWASFIDKIINLLIKLNNENNINGLNGIINLIDAIYTNSCNFKGVIPRKEDTHQVEESFDLFQFYCGTKKHKDYKIRVGENDTIYDMRWKIGYYYDIPVNNVVLMDKKGNKYSFIDDNEIFFNLFPPAIYCKEGHLVQIKILDAIDILLSIKNNPKILIEENENLFKILIENLSNDKQLKNEIKQKIYNIIQKMPKKIFIDENIKIFEQKEKISEEILDKKLNYKNIYILSYFLQCFDYYIKSKDGKKGENIDKEKEEFLKIFIEIQNGEKLLYDILLDAKIDVENICYVQFECIIDIINLIIFINKFKKDNNLITKNYEYIFNNIGLDELLRQLSEIIISILQIKYEFINEHTSTSNYKTIIICDSCKLLDTIIHFIDELNNENKTYYLKYLLINQNLFKEIFLFKYIACKEDKLIEILHNYFLKNIFEDQNLMEIYLKIMLIPDVFKYLIENDTNGNYFKMLTSIMQKYYLKNKEKKLLNKKDIKEFTQDDKKNNNNIIKNDKDTQKNEKNEGQKNKEVSDNKSKEEIKNENKGIDEKENKDEKEIENENKGTNEKENIDEKEIEKKNGKEEKNEIKKVNNNKETNQNEIEQKTLNEEDKKIDNNLITKNEIIDKKENNNILEINNINQFKTIIDLIVEHINHIYNQKPKEDDISNLQSTKESESGKQIFNSQYIEEKLELIRNNKIEGIISFLQSILNLSPEELVQYLLSKINVINLFLNKCILSKCNLNPLESKYPLCNYTSSQESVFNLIIFILRKMPSNENLYKKIINLLLKYHQIGFWKTNSDKNWELSISKISKQKYIGLKNLASTCYMNSILQQIFMISMLRETILSIQNPDKKSVLFQLQLLFSALKVYESQYYDPITFVLANKLNFYEQMDADEYFGMFIDKVENDIKNIYADEKDNKYKELFRFFFGIKALDELKFVDCNHKRYNEFFYNNIQLEVKGFNNLSNSLKNYFKTEIMDGENKINCEECNIKRTCHKRQIFKSLPNILVVNLKRFEFDYNTMLKYKLNNYFEFPFELDMKEYLIENHQETNTKYELTGITIHFGFSDYGHYYDLIKSPDGKWYKFNDNHVYEIDPNDIPHEAFGEKENEDDFIKDIEESDSNQNSAYILIYKKQNFDIDKIENLSKNYNCNLALPPYNKYSNINNEIKSIINIQMFKYWTIQIIVSQGYQNFIINLLKIDLVHNITTESEKLHPELFASLRKEGYEIPNKLDYKKNKSNEIFEFGLKYFFNILLRIAIKPNGRLNLLLYIDILKLYIENDFDKAKFILEEFSNIEQIKEYLVFCPNKIAVVSTEDIILFCFEIYFSYIELIEDKNTTEINDDTIKGFINTYALFINYNINTMSIKNVNSIFYKIVKVSPKIIEYLKNKKFQNWITSFYIEDEEEIMFSEKEFPGLKSDHNILSEKLMVFEGIKIEDKENEINLEDHYINRLKDVTENYQLIHKLNFEFQNFD